MVSLICQILVYDWFAKYLFTICLPNFQLIVTLKMFADKDKTSWIFDEIYQKLGSEIRNLLNMGWQSWKVTFLVSLTFESKVHLVLLLVKSDLLFFWSDGPLKVICYWSKDFFFNDLVSFWSVGLENQAEKWQWQAPLKNTLIFSDRTTLFDSVWIHFEFWRSTQL